MSRSTPASSPECPTGEVAGNFGHCASWAAGAIPGAGLTGFCWGGRIAWLYAAHNLRLKAAVAWQGRVAGVPTENSPCHPIDLLTAFRLRSSVFTVAGIRAFRWTMSKCSVRG